MSAGTVDEVFRRVAQLDALALELLRRRKWSVGHDADAQWSVWEGESGDILSQGHANPREAIEDAEAYRPGSDDRGEIG